MGTSSSNSNCKAPLYSDSSINAQLYNRNNKSANIEEFMQLDEYISKLESTCPGPRIATCSAWLEHLKSYQTYQHFPSDNDTVTKGRLTTDSQLLSELRKNQFKDDLDHLLPPDNDTLTNNLRQKAKSSQRNPGTPFTIPLSVKNNREKISFTENDLEILARDLVNLALNLGIVTNPHQASKHEDFFAQLNETFMDILYLKHYGNIISHTLDRLKQLEDLYQDLSRLYAKYDHLLALISKGFYLSLMEERLYSQLTNARLMRDRLGATLEQWRICGLLLKASSMAANQGLKQWQKVKIIVNPKLKLEAVLLCCRKLQDSLTSFDTAQMSLPQVEIKYVTRRQMSTVRHCSNYIITDISNRIHCEHTTRVFKAYAFNTIKAVSWFYDTFRETLRQDFDRANDNVFNFSETLREHRKTLFQTIRNK